MLQLFIDAVYQVVRHSWMAAAVSLKYVLLVYVLKLLQENRFSRKGFEEMVVRYSRGTITGLVLAGVLFAAAGVEIVPLVTLFSQVVAVAYLLYLFWVY